MVTIVLNWILFTSIVQVRKEAAIGSSSLVRKSATRGGVGDSNPLIENGIIE